MPANLDYALYLNIAFFGILGLGLLGGLLRGFKKSLFTFITMLIFYVVFFLTIDLVANQIWTIQSPEIGNQLSQVDPAFTGVNSLEEAMPVAIETYLSDTINPDLLSADVMSLVSGIGLFVVKIVYTIAYFTVILVFYKFICWLIRIIFFGGKKDHHASKNPLFGAIFGLLNGVMALFVMLIMLGGVMSMAESIVLLSGDTGTEVAIEFPRQDIYEANYSLLGFEAEGETPPDLTGAMEELETIITAYNGNILVTALGSITIPDDSGTLEVPLNLYLFDSVLSFDFGEQKVSIRKEMSVFGAVAQIFLASDFMTTNDIADLKGDEIRDAFALLSGSDFVVAALPIGIEIAAANFEVTLNVTPEELAAIDWETELTRVGVIAGSLFDILNGAGVIAGTGGLETITVDGNAIRDLFDSMGESQLVLLACTAFLEPWLADPANADVTAFLTIPADIDWSTEFPAIGEALGAIFDDTGSFVLADLGLSTITNLSDASIDKLFESRILVATISGAVAQIDTGEGFTLVIPDAVYDLEGYLTSTELKALVRAVQLVVTTVGTTTEFSAAQVFSLTGDQIDTLLDSQILSATMGKLVFDLGTDALVIPDGVTGTVVADGLDVDVVTAVEIKAVFQALAVLGIADFQNAGFDASIIENLESVSVPGTLDTDKIDTLFASGIIHATISKVLLDLTTGAESFIVVPYQDADGVAVRTTVGTINYISTAELTHVLEALFSLGITDFNNVDAMGLQTLIDNQAILFDSAILHASVSKQLFDLAGTITVPYFDETGAALRLTVGDPGLENTYLARTELEAIFEALDVLGLTDISTFSGTVDLSIVTEGTNAATLLASAIIQATISEQILALDADGTLAVPYVAEDGATAIRITVGGVGETTEYISKDELQTIFDALDLLGLTDLETFNGTVDLSILTTGTNSTTLLASSIIHATVSDQILGLDADGTLSVPYVAEDGVTEIRLTVGPLGHTTEYIAKTELEAIFDALDILGLTDLETFNGTVDLSILTTGTNSATLLASSIIHATVSDQILGLDADGTLSVPYVAEDGVTEIRLTVGPLGHTTEYIAKTELEAIFDGLDLLGITNLETFDGTIDLSIITAPGNTAILLSSSIIQATISTQMIDLPDAVLIVPLHAEDGTTAIRVTVGPIGHTTEYVVYDEINALLIAFDLMGFTDLESTGAEIGSDAFFANSATLLASSSIQATLSDKMLTGTGGVLIIPDEDSLANDIRIVLADVTYVKKTEILAILDALEAMGLTDFTTMEFDPATVFASDYVTILNAATMQATFSKTLIDAADAPGSALIIPDVFREDILVDSVTQKQVEKAELIKMLDSLSLLGGADFETLDPTIITGMSSGDLDTLLLSGSVHATISEMAKGNPAVLANVPDLAIADLYGLTDVIIASEIRDFVLASNAISGGTANFENVSITLGGIEALDAGDRDIALTSMIVRNAITGDLEDIIDADPFHLYVLDNADYMNNDPLTFLTKAAILAILAAYGL